MSLKTRGILVLVIGTILGVSLSVGGQVMDGRAPPPRQDLTLDQARLLAEVMARVKRDYVEPIDDAVPHRERHPGHGGRPRPPLRVPRCR